MEEVKESLGLLESTMNDFTDFAIDSDEEMEEEESTPLPLPLSSPPPPTTSTATSAAPSTSVSTSVSASASASVSASVSVSVSSSQYQSQPQSQSAPVSGASQASSSNGSTTLKTLKKQTVTANDDPLSALLNSNTTNTNTNANANTKTATNYSNPNMTMMTGTGGGNGNMNMNIGNGININGGINGGGGTIRSNQPNYPTTLQATSTVTQSLSSTFSSFASKFQDAMSSTTSTYSTSNNSGNGSGNINTNLNINTNTNASINTNFNTNINGRIRPVANGGVGTGTSTSTGGEIYSRNRVTNMMSRNNSAKYVERSVEHNNPVSSSSVAPPPPQPPTSTGVFNQSTSYGSSNNVSAMTSTSTPQTVYSTSRMGMNDPKLQKGGSIGTNGHGSIGNGHGHGGSTIHELDNSLKSSLITSAIGELLPGEKVIVFLSNLLHVRDSSSPQTGIGSTSFHSNTSTNDNNHNGVNSANDLVWCCVVTFYRLVLFSYHESECAQMIGGGNGNNSMPSMQKEEGNPLTDEMKNWIESASVSRQYQHIHSTCLRKGGNRHYVLQMPLASVDRIEKTTEFGIHSNSSLSSQIGFSSAAANLMSGAAAAASGYGDSIGGAVASGTLVVYGKDNGRFVQFTSPSYADCMRAYESLNTYAFPGRRNLGYLFAFESRRAEVMASAKSDEADKQQFVTNGAMRLNAQATPRRYNAMGEFSRMVSGYQEAGQFDVRSPWTPVLRANSTYNLCSSYPSVMFAPSSIDDTKPEGMRLLRDTASFRSGGRLQTLSWASRHDGASLWRSAQPKVGLQGNRSTADELFMKKIGESAALANSQAAVNGKMPARPSVAFLKMLTGGINENDLMLENFRGSNTAAFNEKCMLKIFDLRPKSSAMANRTAGYGYENTSHYKNTTLSFFGIGNIHVVRDSYKKISALCANPSTNDVQWMQLVEETKWLSIIRLILSASWQAAFHVRFNRLPVLVHCSHGWDRTSQVCALAQIFLDPYFRTRAGFSCLVEKDFLALGHPLHTRCGHGEGKGGDLNGSGSSGGQSDEMSPIFLQFLDCVWQIVNQYPDYFEFNAKYLLLLSEHIYSCRFGTLLCDSEREREVVASIRQRTYCLWEYLESCPDLVNRQFSHKSTLPDEEVVNGKGCLFMPLPSLLRNVTLWTDRHCMYGAKPTMRSIPKLDDDSNDSDRMVTQPLHGLHDLKDDSLKMALKEASKWKEIAKLKEEEIFDLKKRLKEVEENNNNVQ